MNVGILTVNGLNCGSFLQAFALKKFIEEDLHHNVCMINTLTPRFLYTPLHRMISEGLIFGLKGTFILLSAWKNLKHTSRLRHYDVVIVGSDIVWAKHKPDIFFGKGIMADKIVAYAPCCGETTYDELDNLRIKGIKSMSALSARDENTAELIYRITGKKPLIVLDPTFLIDWSKYEVLPSYDDYILVYSYNGKIRDMIIQAKELSKETGLKTISIAKYIYWCDISIPVSPFEFLGFVKNAKYVITDTFHGTVFSLVYGKPFISFPHNHKVRYLLKSFGIEENKLFDNYTKIDDELQKRKVLSKKYIRSALKND